MTDWEKIIYTSLITVIGGLILYLLTRLLEGFVLKPIDKWFDSRGKVIDRLFFYSNVYTNIKINPSEMEIGQIRKMNKEFRILAGEILHRASEIKWYKLFNQVGIIPPFEDIKIAQKNLIFLSNNLVQSPASNRSAILDNLEAVKEIDKRLKINVNQE